MQSIRTLRVSLLALAAIAPLSACVQLLGPTGNPSPADDSRASSIASANPKTATDSLQALQAPQRTRLELPEVAAIDLISRLRGQFELPVIDDTAVLAERAWFGRNDAYLQRVFLRAEPILYHIAEALKERGMPSDLALLPIIESAYDPFAYSHGRAAGLWQIIPGTGERLGLKQNWWFDGRRDLFESTRAALDYLESLHQQFGGDWLLAVAGYNSGEGNVARALKRARAAGEAEDFWGIRPYLPRETRTYVPRLLAVRDLVAGRDDNSPELPVIENSPRLAAVETGGQIDMTLAAALAELNVDALYQLNPGINRWATDPDGPHRLVVPIDAAESFAAALQSLAENERVQWTRHRIKPGESLIVIARGYDTTPEVLRAANDIRGNTIRAGDYLLVPHAMQSMEAYTATVDARRKQTQSLPRNGTRRAYTVRRGDSLWSIAQQYGVDTRELARWNAMAPGDVLSVGRELVVWSDAAVPTQAASQINALSQMNALRQINYRVRRGDSLAAIAQRFRVTVNKLVEWNSISVKDYLQPGQRLVLHVDVTEQSS